SRRVRAAAVAVGVLALLALALAAWHWNGALLARGRELLALLSDHAAMQAHQVRLRAAVKDFGPLAPLAFMALQVVQIVVSPLPGELTGLLGGALFGVLPGLAYSTVGLGLGSAAAFFLSRQFRRLIRPWLVRSELYRRLAYLLDHQGLFVIWVFYLLPGFPKDFLCYLLGLSRMPWQVFVVVATVGRIPGTLMLTLQGAKIYEGDWKGLAVVLGITLALSLPAWIWRESIYRWVERHEGHE
ncbi:TVP38/TMEM64 family protein, partial [Dissulfurirhabdus thermomarina]